jgi:hypothetical protein
VIGEAFLPADPAIDVVLNVARQHAVVVATYRVGYPRPVLRRIATSVER